MEEAASCKNQGTGNSLLMVTEIQRAVYENPRNWRERTAIERTAIERKGNEHLSSYVHYSYSMALGF